MPRRPLNIGPSVRPQGTLKTYILWFRESSRGVRLPIAAGAALNVLSVALSMTFVYISKTLIDIATGDSGRDLVTWAVLLAVTMLSQTGINALRTRLHVTNDIRIKNKLRHNLFSRLIHVYRGSRGELHSGDITNRLEEDVRVLADALSSLLPSVVSTVLQFCAAFVFLLMLKPGLAWAIVGIMPFGVIFSRFFFRKVRKLTLEIRELDSRVQELLQEDLQNATLMQTMEQGDNETARLSELQTKLFRMVNKRNRFTVASRAAIGTAFSAGYATAFIWGVVDIHNGLITFGTMTAFLQLVGQIQRPLMDLSSQIPAFVHAAASIDRLKEIEGDEPGQATPVHIPAPVGIRISGVTFRYPDGTRNILDNFSHDFPPGSSSAIVGETGAGKSTLIRLILALLKPEAGTITFYSGTTTATASAATRCNISYVPQGNSLLSGTVRDNLLLGDPDATDDQLREALSTAAAEFVFDLPQGVDTPCAEGGAGLSEGQAQRIAIARALLRRSSVLLLDEFSSSLDPDTEKRLLENLSIALRGRTVIFVTHRQKICEYCDEVIQLERQ